MVTAPVSPVFTFLFPLPWSLLLPHLHETQAEHHQWSVCFGLLDIHSLRFDRGRKIPRNEISVVHSPLSLLEVQRDTALIGRVSLWHKRHCSNVSEKSSTSRWTTLFLRCGGASVAKLPPKLPINPPSSRRKQKAPSRGLRMRQAVFF